MLYALTIMPEHVVIVVLSAIVAMAVVAYFLRKDAAIDERQEKYSKLGGLLEKWQLTRLASIMHSVAALNLDAVIQKVRALVDSLEDDEDVLTMLAPNWFYQLPRRIKRAQDREKVLEEVVKDPDCRAKLAELLEEG